MGREIVCNNIYQLIMPVFALLYLVKGDKVELVAVEGLGLAVNGGRELDTVPFTTHTSVNILCRFGTVQYSLVNSCERCALFFVLY